MEDLTKNTLMVLRQDRQLERPLEIQQESFLRVSKVNEKIERKLRCELNTTSRFDKLLWGIKEYVNTRWLGKQSLTIEELIQNQINQVRLMNLNFYALVNLGEQKLDELEQYHLSLNNNLHAKKNEHKILIGYLEGHKRALLKEKKKEFKRTIQKELFEIKLREEAIKLLEKEIPKVDDLIQVYETFTFYCKRLIQESEYTLRHFSNIKDIYIHAIRINNLDYNIEREFNTIKETMTNMQELFKDSVLKISKKRYLLNGFQNSNLGLLENLEDRLVADG